jgi:tetratricopeptide (TPR) repeat protein
MKRIVRINRIIVLFGWLVGIQFYFSNLYAQTQNNELKQLEKQLIETKIDTVKVKILLKISDYNRKIDLIKSMAADQEALTIARRIDDQNLVARSVSSLGTSCMNAGLYDLAVDYYIQMEKVGQDLQDPQIIGKAKFNIATIKVVLEDFKGANDDLELAVDQLKEYYKSLGSEVPVSIRLSFENNLGVNAKGLGRMKEAKAHFLNGIQLAKESNSTQSTIFFQLMNNYGDLLTIENTLDSAFQVFQQANIGLDSFPDQGIKMLTFLNLGKLRQLENKHQEALSFLSQAYEIASTMQNYSGLRHISESLSQSFQALSEPDSALRYSNLQKEYNDKLGVQKASEELLKADLLSKFEEEQRLIQEKYATGGMFYLAFLGVFMLAAAVMIFLYIKWKGKYHLLQAIKSRIENQAKKVDFKNKNLEAEIQKRNKDLALMTMNSIQQKELVDTIAQKIKNKSSADIGSDSELFKAFSELKNTGNAKIWEEFEIRFKNIHSNFYDELMRDFPTLTLNERRLSAFLKLQMTTKEIASLTGQSIRAVELARTRLRKKLQLTNSEINLYNFILNYGN